MRSLTILQLFIGISALAGGYGIIIDPSGDNLGLEPEWLKGSVFSSYAIPGWVLFLVIGAGNIAACAGCLKRKRYAGETAIALGVFLMIWILIQVIIIPHNWLQPLYFFFGLMQMGFGIGVRKQLKSINPDRIDTKSKLRIRTNRVK